MRATKYRDYALCSNYTDTSGGLHRDPGLKRPVRAGQQGTLFLDEIGDLSVDLQAKRLQVLQDGTYERVGGTQTLQADVRLLYATHQDLSRAMEESRFRADRFYRINVLPIRLPALREHIADLPLLAQAILGRQEQQWGWPTPRMTPDFLQAVMAYSWPGNVRELESFLRQTLLKAQGAEVLDRDHLQGLLANDEDSSWLAKTLARLFVGDIIPRDDLLRPTTAGYWN